MTYFFKDFWFEPGSRMTGIWLWPWGGVDEANDLVALVSQVRLGAGQDGELESDFLCSHLPWAIGGFHGVDPSGDPWLVVVQIASGEVAQRLVASTNPWWPLVDGLERALHHNREATLDTDRGLTRVEVLDIYERAGIDPAHLADWSLTELMAGLLAECTYVPLTDIVAGRITGCAFPVDDHECAHDVFHDVFNAWVQGRLAHAEPDPDEGGSFIPFAGEFGHYLDAHHDDEEEDDQPSPPMPRAPATHRVTWSKKKVKKWSKARLRLQAVEEGLTAEQARTAGRKRLERYLTTPHIVRPRKRVIRW